MRITYGYSGWVRVTTDESDDPPDLRVYLRMDCGTAGLWRTHELYMEGDQALSAQSLRKLPLAKIEAVVLQGGGAERLRRSMRAPGPQLRIMAETFATRRAGQRPNCGCCGGLVNTKNGRALTWLETSWWAQHEDVVVARPAPPDVPAGAEKANPPDVPPLHAPEVGLTDDFLRHVAAAYDAAIRDGEPPAPTLAEQAGAPTRTVHRWIYTARQRGLMAPGKRGRAG